MEKTTQISATPNEGYEFVNWTEEGIVISTTPEFTFEVTKDTHLIANFQKKTFSIQIGLLGSGDASGAGSYQYGDEVTLIATPDVNYKFTGWFLREELISSEEVFTFIIDKDYNLTAKFEEIFYNVTLEAVPIEGGTVTGGGVI